MSPNRNFRLLAWLLALSVLPVTVVAQSIPCEDELRLWIDLKKFAAEYSTGRFAEALDGLNVLGARLEGPAWKLPAAAAATHKWDVFLKGVADAYSTCGISMKVYKEATEQLYPLMKEDAGRLEEIRKAVSAGRKTEAAAIQAPLDRYYASLRRFAQIGRKEMVLDQIEGIAQSLPARNTGGAPQVSDSERILARIEDLEARNKQAPLESPSAAGNRISDVMERSPEKARQAQAAYARGYELFQQYRFPEAVPHLQQAVAVYPLPEFCLALGRAYAELPDLAQAESILRKGLEETGKGEKGENTDMGSGLASEVASVLMRRGDLESALGYAQRVLKIDEKIHGADQPDAAVDAAVIARILRAKGDLEGALSYSQSALAITEKIYGPSHPEAAREAENTGQILKARGDLSGALSYLQRALKIFEKTYGEDSPMTRRVAIEIEGISKAQQGK